VHAYEIDPRLADLATQALGPCEHVSVHPVTALGGSLPPADVIYVNAGLSAPDAAWLEALRPGGRLIMPWQPFAPGGVTLKVTRVDGGYRAEPSTMVGFVDCVGAASAEAGPPPRPDAVESTRSVWLARQRAPDDTATAVYGEVWFSADPV
jgi:protein-L-isoaspartate(D-aspartate) O-methyltransferase